MKKILLFAAILILLLCSCNQDSTVAREQYYWMYAHLSEMWAQSLVHGDAEIAFFGDSRIVGADWYSAFPEEKVINLGVGGDRVGNLITRLSQVEILAKSGNLKKCFVAVGGNDCLSSKFDAGVFESEYEELIKKFEGLGITIYVNTIAGVSKQSSSLSESKIDMANDQMARANDIIRSLAEKHGIECIEIAALMNNEDGSLKAQYAVEDGVHFSEEGNQIWFDTLSPYVE